MLPDLTFHFPLCKARVHEICGNAALNFCAIVAGQSSEYTLWIRQAWRSDRLNPAGLSAFCSPSRILLAQVKDQMEGLAMMEEALRDGSVPSVIVELDQPLDLTAGRRLQLAAKTGGTTGLCVIPDGMGSNAAETRWRCNPVFDSERSDSTLMRWSLIKNKSGTLCDWYVCWNPNQANPADRLAVVSPPGK
ncbi:ImuA family protein [Cochlodiniinecator piscidefendens]|uniref:ImuA family protein n=1 Tax=Cochlodiniinecator piscidefendens TaxID=2715756 RepID=UPI00140C25A9|nr:hypothetical protein [Cochlodiniinecator piscidefendens]